MEEICSRCPRKCGINRNLKAGVCGETNTVQISKVMIHEWEEPIISGTKGSGAIFFAGCNLKCIYCQNSEISSGGVGKSYTIKELAEVFKNLQEKGVHNINLVTPTHYSKQIVEALKIFKPTIPIVWNTSSYELPETLEELRGFVDIFLADLKYCSSELSEKLSNAKDYYEIATKAILKMKEIQPDDIIENGIMKKGLILRHLILPTQTKDSLKIVDWIASNLPKSTIVSIMSQYTPCYKTFSIPWLNQKIKPLENKIVVSACEKHGLTNGFYQDLESSSTSYIPKFDEN